jgi:hypothetical protein
MYLRSDSEWRDEAICGGRGSSAVRSMRASVCSTRRWTLLGVKFLSRLLAALNLLPSIATIASEKVQLAAHAAPPRCSPPRPGYTPGSAATAAARRRPA